jgi:hypothetical protein
MNNPIHNEAEAQAVMNEKSFDSTDGAETNEGANMSMKDADTILSMIVLLLSCLALAALAHVFV